MFNPSVRILSELQSNIRNDNLEGVVICPFLAQFMASRNNSLIDYILLNLKKIYEYAIYINQAELIVSARCFEIITSGKGNLNKEIINNPTLLDLIRNTVDDLENQTEKTRLKLFTLLEILCTQTPGVFVIFSNQDYLKKILQYISDSECAHLISNFTRNWAMKAVLISVNIQDIVVAEILKNNENVEDYQKLFNELYLIFPNSSMYKAITNNNALAQIVQNAIEYPSASSFHFLDQLVNISLKYAAWNSWRSVFNMIESRVSDIAKVFLDSERFTKVSEEILNLMLSIFIEDKKVSKELFSIYLKICQDFFKYPNHGILHNKFVFLLTVLEKNECLTNDLLSKSNLFGTIMSTVQQRNEIFASYWGQLREISEMIDPLFVPTDNDSKVKWAHLMSAYKEEELIISNPYGGKATNSSHVFNILVILILIMIFAIVMLFILK